MNHHPRGGTHDTAQSEPGTESMGGCLTRVGWLVTGPLALLVLGLVVARKGNGPFAAESILYWGVVAVALLARYIDIFRFRGQTSRGAPASRDDWRRYRLRLPALALAGWCAALWIGES